MRHIKLIFILLTVVLFTVTCKKEHIPAPTTTTPVFYFNGTVNGVSTSLNAGVNNYYMYSSYTQDSNQVHNFIGDLKQTTSSLNSIQIQINDYKVNAANGSTQPDSAFGLVNYSYYSVGVTDTTYNVQFIASYGNGTAQTYTWDFGDSTTFVGTSATQSHVYALKGAYNVCVTISGSAGTSSICNIIDVNIASSNVTPENATIVTTSLGNFVTYSVSTTFTAKQFRWDFGDSSSIITYNNTSGPINDTTNHSYSSPGVYPVSLTIVDSMPSNDSIIIHYNASTASYTSGTANFKINSVTKVITTGSALRLSNVIVKWTDANGVVYTSDNAAQPAVSTFKILSEEAYQNNINGQSTRKLHVNFSCTLYNSGHPSIQITNADAVIVVAYK